MYIPHPLPVKDESEIKPASVAARRHRRNRAIRNLFAVLVPIVIAKNPEDKKFYNPKTEKATPEQRKKKRRASARRYYRKNRKKKIVEMREYKKTPAYKNIRRAYESTPEFKAYRQDYRRRCKEREQLVKEALSEMPAAARKAFEQGERLRIISQKKIFLERKRINVLNRQAEAIEKKNLILAQKEEILWKMKVDKAILRLRVMKETRKERYSEMRIIPMQIVSDKLRKYRNVARHIEEERRRGLGILEVA